MLGFFFAYFVLSPSYFSVLGKFALWAPTHRIVSQFFTRIKAQHGRTAF